MKKKKTKPRNFVEKNLRIGETGWKPTKQLHKSKKKYTRKKKHSNDKDYSGVSFFRLFHLIPIY